MNVAAREPGIGAVSSRRAWYGASSPGGSVTFATRDSIKPAAFAIRSVSQRSAGALPGWNDAETVTSSPR